MPLNVTLVVVGGDVKTTEIKLKLPSTIGRGRGTGIVLPHPLVSRQHCELFEASGQLMVRDLGSLNGTFVNNERVTEAPLPPGELLTIGTVTFRAAYDLEAKANQDDSANRKVEKDEKTVRVNRGTTLAAKRKPAASAPANSDSDLLDFDLSQPSPADQRATERLTPLTQAAPEKKQPSSGKAQPTQPSPSKKTPPPADEDDDDPAASESDDDLNDFLQGLKD